MHCESTLSTVHMTAMYTTASLYSQEYTWQQCTPQPVRTLDSTQDSNVRYSQSILSTVHKTAMYTTASLYSWQYTGQQCALQPVCTLDSTQDSNVHYSQTVLLTVHRTPMYTTASVLLLHKIWTIMFVTSVLETMQQFKHQQQQSEQPDLKTFLMVALCRNLSFQALRESL
jgi:hypothetical protein